MTEKSSVRIADPCRNILAGILGFMMGPGEALFNEHTMVFFHILGEFMKHQESLSIDLTKRFYQGYYIHLTQKELLQFPN